MQKLQKSSFFFFSSFLAKVDGDDHEEEIVAIHDFLTQGKKQALKMWINSVYCQLTHSNYGGKKLTYRTFSLSKASLT